MVILLLIANINILMADVCKPTYEREDPTSIQLALIDIIKCQSKDSNRNFELLLNMMNKTLQRQVDVTANSNEQTLLSKMFEYLLFGIFFSISLFLIKQLFNYGIFLMVQNHDGVAEIYLAFSFPRSKWFRAGRSPLNIEGLRSDMAPPILCRCCHKTTIEV